MESWSYASEGRGFMFSDLSVYEVPKGPFLGSNTGVGMFAGGEVGIDSGKLVVTSPNCIVGSNSSLESGSNQSNSFMESNSQESSLIDLKLGRLVDVKDVLNDKFCKERSVLSSVNQTVLTKRARTANSRTQTPFCQVYGCNKDLSSSKDYHKRHKVCEVHSKSPKVIVNGIEQRFCQQCSRFHLLVEFDDGKRSCRKRLAGHNERRRKPQFSTLSTKPQKLLHSYQGTKFLGTCLPKRASFLFPNVLPGGILYPEKYEQTSWCRNVKLEEKETYNPQLAVSTANGQLLPKSFLHLHGNGIQCTSGVSSSVTKDHTVFNTASTIHELAGVSHSSRALSLLSAESQDLSHSSRNVMVRPLISQASYVQHHSLGISDRPLGLGSSEKYVPNGFISSGMNSIEDNHIGSFMISDNGHAANLQVEADGFVQGSGSLNAKYCVSPEHGSTVTLLQLSSHLQRVEQQRNSMHVKQENEDFCNLFTTYGLRE